MTAFAGAVLVTKRDVLEILAKRRDFVKPDEIAAQLPGWDRRSVYSYLLRLYRQGLLARKPGTGKGSLAYRLTGRGSERLEYFRRKR